jgi:hypothetical protein
MHKVLTDDELVQIEPDFVLFCADRGLGINDDLFRVMHLLLVSSDDAREALVAYIKREAQTIRAQQVPLTHRDQWHEEHGIRNLDGRKS